jgi:hypothetical protein
VKRCGKSAPPLQQWSGQGKPHTEQDQIGRKTGSERKLQPDACRLGAPNLRVGRLSHAVMRGPEEWPSCWSNPADRIRLIGPAAIHFLVPTTCKSSKCHCDACVTRSGRIASETRSAGKFSNCLGEFFQRTKILSSKMQRPSKNACLSRISLVLGYQLSHLTGRKSVPGLLQHTSAKSLETKP